MKEDISFPIEVVKNNLSLEEVGAICVLLCSPSLSDSESNKWGTNPQFVEIFNGLVDKGLISLDKDENGGSVVHIVVDKPDETQIVETQKMTVAQALKQLKKDHSLNKDDLKKIEDLIEDIASSYYYMGYDDRMFETSTPQSYSYYPSEKSFSYR